MVLTVTINDIDYELELDNQERVTVDYKIFPMTTIGDTGISHTSSFVIPKTDYNVETLNLAGEIGSVAIKCILESENPCDQEDGVGPGDYSPEDYNEDYLTQEIATGNSFRFVGDLYIDTEVFDSEADTYSVMVVDELKTKMDKLDENIDDLFTNYNDGVFQYYWLQDDSYAPVSPTELDFFFTSANFNGYIYDEDASGGPVYTAKFLERDIFQVYWTWNYYRLFKKMMDRYDIAYNFVPSSNITPLTTLNDLYIGIPAPLETINSRNMSVSVGNDGVFSNIADYGNQLTLEPAAVVATCDTLYKIQCSIDFSANPFVMEHYIWEELACSGNFYPLTPEDNSKMFLVINARVVDSDGLVGEIAGTCELAEIFLGDNFITDNIELELMLKAGTQYRFELGVRYQRYRFEDLMIVPVDNGQGEFDCIEVANGFKELNGQYDESPSGLRSMPEFSCDLNTNPIDLVFFSVKTYSPLFRESFKEWVSPKKSLERISVTSKAILNDILKRYNIGVWFDSNQRINLGPYTDRYRPITENVVDLRNRTVDEKHIKHYTRDLIKEFTYKNKTTKAVNYKQEIGDYDDPDKFSSGDVLPFMVSETGVKDVTVSLKSSPYYKDIYGGKETGDFETLNLYNNMSFWGFGENKQLKYNQLNICHGWIEDTARTPDIKSPVVVSQEEVTDDEDDVHKYVVTYQTFANLPDDYDSKTVPMYFLQSEKEGVDTLLLGDEDGVLDANSSILSNFDILFDVTGGGEIKEYIEYEIPISTCEVIMIINGYKAYVDANDDVYLPISIEGVEFDQFYSLVKIKLIKE